MRTLKGKASSISLGLAMAVGVVSLIAWGDAYASSIQTQPAAKIFAASCSTCHGGLGNGGVTWIRDFDEALGEREAPDISYVDFNRDGAYNSLDVNYIKMKVRNGSNNGAMPAFGKEEITDAELNNLATALVAGTSLVPTAPASFVTLDILDADPWFTDRGNDSAADPLDDPRRVVLAGTTQALKVVNTGRTWHTLTDKTHGKDSGFIGYAGNHHNTPGDLDQGVGAGIGYYYAVQGNDLTTASATTVACNRYLCKMHPYMQVEVCTGGVAYSGPTTAGVDPIIGAYAGLTRAHKHPLPAPTTLGIGEVWVATQSQDLSSEDTLGPDPGNGRSVIGMDGTYQVIDAESPTWDVSFVTDANNNIANVGNNPHNAWPNVDNGTNHVVLSASWHDNTISLMDATNKKILMERRSGSTNAHVMSMPIGSHETGRFFITHMGGRAIQEINADDLRLGNDPNVPGRLVRGNTGPHGLWTCGDGIHILTADTFGGSATWYNIDTKKRSTTTSGGTAPLAPALFDEYPSTVCDRGFTNNALTADISVYNMTGDVITNDAGASWAPGLGLFENTNNNIDLRVLPGDANYADQVVAVPGETISQAKWAHLPIQTPVSPADSVPGGHGRYLVTANKASFNVTVTKLDASGNPVDQYNFPAGLGAHGVTYGKKSLCDDGAGTCYYAYVTNTLEDYVSVYDLEKIENGGMGVPGSALLAETVYVEGGAVEAVIALDPVTAGLCDVIEVTVGPCGPPSSITGGSTAGGLLGTVAPYSICLAPVPGPFDVLDCGVGAMDGVGINAGGTLGLGAIFVSNLPIGVLCPDCRDGVHVGDIPLDLTTGEALGVGATAALATNIANNLGIADSLTTNDGATAKYTYLKEEVWVDTDTVACVVDTLIIPGPFVVNDCLGGTSGAYLGNSAGAAPAGTINTTVTLDLDLGINTGGQGIMGRGSSGYAPVVPW